MDYDVEWLSHPRDPSKPVMSPETFGIRAIPISSTSSPPQFAHPDFDWDWSSPHTNLANLSADQLAGWRRMLLRDQFKPPIRIPKTSLRKSSSPDRQRDSIKSTSKSIVDNDPSPANDAQATDSVLPTGTSSGFRDYAGACRLHLPAPVPHPSIPYYPDTHTNTVEPVLPAPINGSETPDPDMRFAYIFQSAPVRGKFDVQRAVELGVPKGKSFGVLASGQSVTVKDPDAPNGERIVLPSDVMGETQEGGCCIIVDVAKAHMDNLLQSREFDAYRGPGSKRADVIVHRLTNDVLADPRWLEWAKSFGEETSVSCKRLVA